jgi:hypothetical protein
MVWGVVYNAMKIRCGFDPEYGRLDGANPEIHTMAFLSAEKHQWERLCKKYSRRPLFRPDVVVTAQESGAVLRAVWPGNPLVFILTLKGAILGGVMLTIAAAIATGLKTGRPEYVPILGSLGCICLGLNLLSVPVQRMRINGKSIDLTFGRFPFHKSASLPDDGAYRVQVRDKLMPVAEDRNRHGPALCLVRPDEDGEAILVAGQEPDALRLLEDSLNRVLERTNR